MRYILCVRNVRILNFLFVLFVSPRFAKAVYGDILTYIAAMNVMNDVMDHKLCKLMPSEPKLKPEIAAISILCSIGQIIFVNNIYIHTLRIFIIFYILCYEWQYSAAPQYMKSSSLEALFLLFLILVRLIGHQDLFFRPKNSIANNMPNLTLRAIISFNYLHLLLSSALILLYIALVLAVLYSMERLFDYNAHRFHNSLGRHKIFQYILITCTITIYLVISVILEAIAPHCLKLYDDILTPLLFLLGYQRFISLLLMISLMLILYMGEKFQKYAVCIKLIMILITYLRIYVYIVISWRIIIIVLIFFFRIVLFFAMFIEYYKTYNEAMYSYRYVPYLISYWLASRFQGLVFSAAMESGNSEIRSFFYYFYSFFFSSYIIYFFDGPGECSLYSLYSLYLFLMAPESNLDIIIACQIKRFLIKYDTIANDTIMMQSIKELSDLMPNTELFEALEDAHKEEYAIISSFNKAVTEALEYIKDDRKKSAIKESQGKIELYLRGDNRKIPHCLASIKAIKLAIKEDEILYKAIINEVGDAIKCECSWIKLNKILQTINKDAMLRRIIIINRYLLMADIVKAEFKENIEVCECLRFCKMYASRLQSLLKHKEHEDLAVLTILFSFTYHVDPPTYDRIKKILAGEDFSTKLPEYFHRPDSQIMVQMPRDTAIINTYNDMYNDMYDSTKFPKIKSVLHYVYFHASE